MPVSPFPAYNGGGNKNFITSGLVTIKSIASGTANVADLTNGGGINIGNTITGDVTVERYINIGQGPGQHGKSWQFMATPTKGQTVFQSWMENGSLASTGYGTQVISPTGSGFDNAPVVYPSVKYYMLGGSTDPSSPDWKGIDNTGIQVYSPNGYMVFVRGDRSIQNPFTAANNTTLRTKGTLLTYDVNVSAVADAFTSIGNPYASAIDMTKVNKAGGLNQFYSAWNAPGYGNYGYGLYLTYSLINGNYQSTPGGVVNNNIESGQAFFVQTTGSAGNMTFSETSKAGSASNNNDFRISNTKGLDQLLRTNFYSIDANGNKAINDGTLFQFNDAYSNKIDGMDARKIGNPGVNLSIKSGNKSLIIESRNLPKIQDTLFFNLTGTAAQKYQFEFVTTGMSADGLKAYLEDTYLHTLSPLNMEDTTLVNVAIDNNAASKAANRFRIVFKQEIVLPVTITAITASIKGQDILVDWKVNHEKNIRQYDVERSFDGILFTKQSSTLAKNTDIADYTWLDEHVLPGYYYYRIRMTDNSGKISYSKVVTVLVGDGKSLIKIYPNPITDGMIHLQFINQPAGKYGIRLMNNLGQIIVSKQIERASGSNTETIKWNYNLAHGIYQLEITQPNGEIKIIKVLY
jgi:hypothetical protein